MNGNPAVVWPLAGALAGNNWNRALYFDRYYKKKIARSFSLELLHCFKLIA